ncbi:restriction endonuclease subunit S [Nostoc punctiforme]|uniref:Restriction modification system DNA specificity domain protein n=1 Tax=Nostoc punctiforme (strain ATCC 29133 / PCC 73102) TaxID=63737 RepID=B2J095_NOSP7|nr:restriction endonuclease subunit S [Nostoc punctiforme]ACC83247.1 restriction modification system DNA specificity domain protein [Nostoc punctiforme PCC 73102]
MSDELTELPEGWQWKNLGEVFEIFVGATPSRKIPEYWDGSIPWVSSGEVAFCEIYETRETITELGLKNTSTELHPPGTVLLGMIGEGKTRGQAAILKIYATHNQNSAAIRVSEIGLPPEYVYYFLKLEYERTRQIGSGNNQQALNKSRVQLMSFPVPPLNEQKRIVANIEELNDRTQRAKEALDSIPQLCDRFRQSVLAAAFRGDLTADWRDQNPDVEPASVLLERIRRDRRCRWEELEVAKMQSKGKVVEECKWKEKYQEPDPLSNFDLPELPNGWVWTKWEQVGFCQNGRAFPSKEYQTNGVKLLRPGNLHVSGEIEWNDSNTRYLSEDWAEQYPDYLISTNELVINLTAQSLADEFLGRICLTGEDERCLLNQRIARLVPIIISPRFLFWLFKSKLFRSYVDDLNTGSLIQHIFTPQINKFHFPLPPLKEQQMIVNLIETQINSIENIGLKAGQMQNAFPHLNQSILAKAFRGELVPQEPDDEPASVLLERIRAKRDKLNNSKPKSDRTSKRKRKTVEGQGVIPGLE